MNDSPQPTTDSQTNTEEHANTFITVLSVWNAIYPQVMQLLISTVLLMVTNYFQQIIVEMTSTIKVTMSDIQTVYLNQSNSLYTLSMSNATGIIEVNDINFLINFDLVKKINFVTDSATVSLHNPSGTPVEISAEEVKSVLNRYKNMFNAGGNIGKLCIVTMVNNIISIKIPEISTPTSLPALGDIKNIGDWAAIHQGYPADSCIYLINKKTKQTYIFKSNGVSIPAFQYKDEKNDIYITMTSNSITLGNKNFMLIQIPNTTVQASVRIKAMEDIMGLAI